MKTKTMLIAWLFVAVHGVSAAAELPRIDPIPGGTALIPLTAESEPMPKAFFQDNRVMVVGADGYWQALVGLPLSLEPGEHKLYMLDKNGLRQTYTFTVRPKEYAVQHITLKNRRQVFPTAEDLKRIERESRKTVRAFRIWNDALLPALRFDLPVRGRISSTFGLRRFFNNEPRRPHSGVDIAAPAGTPITAPEAGAVIMTGHFFFNGKTVFLDHGQGLVSMFNHLSKIEVKQGALVERGQRIGRVGKTGRVTGPHLHWTVSLNNTRIDPLLFVFHASDVADKEGKEQAAVMRDGPKKTGAMGGGGARN